MLCEKIRIVREARGKTQAQIAKTLGISVTSYAKMERGEVDITLARYEHVCKALQVKPFLLFLDCSPVFVIGEKIDLNNFV